MILLSDTNIQGAELLAERIRNSIERHTLAYGMKAINITVSLGVSSLRSDDTAETFVKRADEALFTAKSNGRNQVVLAE